MSTDYNRRGVKLPPTQSEAAAALAARDFAARECQRVGALFTRPDDDWDPLWVVLTSAGMGTVITGRDDKHLMTRRVSHFAQQRGAIAIAHLHSSWGIFAADGLSAARMQEIHRVMSEQGGSTQGIPERREMLMLATYTAASWTMDRALIKRHASGPPTCEPFEVVATDKTADGYGGLMADPLREALIRLG